MNVLEYGKAICYSGYREGQSPKTEVPSKEQIKEDLNILLADGYRYLRMYDPNTHAERVLEIIRENGMPMQCIIGIDSDPEVNNKDCPFVKAEYTEEELAAHAKRNDEELEKLIDMANRYPNEIAAVSIGNENTPSWGAHMVPVDRLIRHAKRLKEGTNKPVTFCEGIFEWPQLGELAKYLDFISVHSYPLHYRNSIDIALDENKKHYRQVKELYHDKQVIFTELGWSTRPNKAMLEGEANEENQARYIGELNEWLEQEQIIGFIFEAFDEPWKGSTPESSECNWGLYYVDRTPKLVMQKK